MELVLTSEIPTVEIPRALEGILGMKMSLSISASVRLNSVKTVAGRSLFGFDEEKENKEMKSFFQKAQKVYLFDYFILFSYFEKRSVFFFTPGS